jgi:hypothetical protein
MMERRFFGDNWLCDALFCFVDGAVVAVAPVGRLCGKWIAKGIGSRSSAGIAIGESDSTAECDGFDRAQSDRA